MEGNKKHKDRVFRKLFGYEKYKGNLLELYNALNDSNYTMYDAEYLSGKAYSWVKPVVRTLEGFGNKYIGRCVLYEHEK